MITEEMIATVEMILGNAQRIGAASSMPTMKASMLTARQLGQHEMADLGRSMAEPIADFIVRAHLQPNGMIRRDTIFVSEDSAGPHTEVSAQVNLLSNEEMSYLSAFIMKLRQARLQQGLDETIRPS